MKDYVAVCIYVYIYININIYIYIHASLQKRILRTPGPYTHAYTDLKKYKIIAKYIHASVRRYSTYTHPCLYSTKMHNDAYVYVYISIVKTEWILEVDIADRSMPFSGEKDSARTPVGQYATSKTTLC